MKIVSLDKGNSLYCEKVLRDLPDWFGIEESTKAYIEKSKTLPMVVVLDESENQPMGFLSLLTHSEYTAEVYVMGVAPKYHRQGIGKVLLREAEKNLLSLGFEFLQVKTVSEDRECEFYKKTRMFYKSQGFKEVEVFPTLWDESNPCQLLIKSIKNEIRGINHITLSVSNLETSFNFYKEILGFTPKMRSSRSAYFLAGSFWFAIEEDENVRTKALPEYTHVAFDVEEKDFSSLAEEIKRSGVKVFKENQSEGASLYFLDPDGHKLEIHCGDINSRLTVYSKDKEKYKIF